MKKFGKMASVLGFMMLGGACHAEAYPSRPISLVVPYAAGGPTDVTARLLADSLSRELGQAVVVENRPGASGMVAMAHVAKAKPDGYTLAYTITSTMVTAPLVQKNTSFDPVRDFTPISNVVDYSLVLMVNNDLPAKSINELVDYAKKNPEAISYGSSGVGGTNHMAGELLALRTGAKMLHVPYKGNAPAISDLISGRISYMFDVVSTAQPYIESKRLRPLAVTTPERNATLSDIPTVREALNNDYEVTGWFGIFGPAGMPGETVAKLEKAVAAAVKDEKLQSYARNGGISLAPSTSRELGKRLADDIALWSDVVSKSDIKIEQ